MKIFRVILFALFFVTISSVSFAFAGGTLRLDEVPVGELDPAKASDYADSILMFNVYDTLVLPAQGRAGHVGHLAESWESDGQSFTFQLRDDVKFHSGDPLTAEDVVYSLERIKALGSGLSYLFDVVEKVEAIGSHTVRFTLFSPYSPFVSSLVRLPIINKVLVEANKGDSEWGEQFLSSHAAGSGAYRVTSHNPQEETVMVKNGEYFINISEEAPDIVRLRYGLEAATVRTLIAQGKHDISSQWLPPEVLKALANEGSQLFTETGTGGFYFKMNTTKSPLDDLHCRRALVSAFDYDTAVKMGAITDEVSGGSPATGAIPKGMFGANDESMRQSQNLVVAKEHLAKCSYNLSDIDIEISWIAEVPLEERFALLFQSNLAKLGVKSHIVKMPWALFTERVAKAENSPHISQLFVSAITGDPDTLLYGMYHSSTPGTWQSPEYLNDARVDVYLEAGRTAKTDEKRHQSYSQLNERLLELAPTIYVYDRQSVFAASKRVKAPALTDPSKAFGLDGMGFMFRLMEVED